MSNRHSIRRAYAETLSTATVPSTDCVVVSLDGASPHEHLVALRRGIHEVLEEGRPILVVDVSRLSRLPSPTIAALLSAKRRCRARRIDMVVRQDRRRSHPLVERVGLACVFSPAQHIGAQSSGRRSR